jgi:hypothetical protein
MSELLDILFIKIEFAPLHFVVELPTIEVDPKSILFTCDLSIIEASVPLRCSSAPVEDSGAVGGVNSAVYRALLETLKSEI